MERAQLEVGGRYALRYVRTLGEPLIEVRMLEYVPRSRKVKVDLVGGDHPGMIEYIHGRQLLCRWKDARPMLSA